MTNEEISKIINRMFFNEKFKKSMESSIGLSSVEIIKGLCPQEALDILYKKPILFFNRSEKEELINIILKDSEVSKQIIIEKMPMYLINIIINSMFINHRDIFNEFIILNYKTIKHLKLNAINKDAKEIIESIQIAQELS